MLIDPDFLDHWRTRDLVDALGNDEMAPTYLIRLWGHCQIRKSDTFAIPTKGLRLICRYAGDAERLESALIEAGWIERDGDNIRALKWLEHNRGLTNSWENGQRGGRPKKPMGNPRVTHGEPMANPWQTHGEPIGVDKREQESKAKAKQAVRAKKSEGSSPVIREIPEPPELEPVIAAVSAWGAGTISGSAAARVALVLDTLARQHPIADPATGTDADPQAVCLALVADLRSKPDTPGPSQVSRVRSYADAVLSTCAAEGRMPGAQSEWKGKKTKLTVAEEKDARCHKENGDWLDGQ